MYFSWEVRDRQVDGPRQNESNIAGIRGEEGEKREEIEGKREKTREGIDDGEEVFPT